MFQGSLGDVKLPDIIQLMSVSSKTGCFVITRENEDARIYLENGQITHACLGHLHGEDAIYSIAIWEDGKFAFHQEETVEDRTVNKRNTSILMEVARKLDEWRVLRKKIPTLGLIPEFETLGNKKVSFNTQQWQVLSKINGVDSINAIAAATNMIAIDVAKLIYGLVASGLVSLRELPKENPDANPLTSNEQSTATGAKRTPEEERDWLLGKVERIYQKSKVYLGEMAQPVIQRHCSQAVKKVNQGKGLSVAIEAATQVVKACQVLHGSGQAKELTEELKKIISEP